MLIGWQFRARNMISPSQAASESSPVKQTSAFPLPLTLSPTPLDFTRTIAIARLQRNHGAQRRSKAPEGDEVSAGV